MKQEESCKHEKIRKVYEVIAGINASEYECTECGKPFFSHEQHAREVHGKVIGPHYGSSQSKKCDQNSHPPDFHRLLE